MCHVMSLDEHNLDKKTKLFCIKTRFTHVTLIGMFMETTNGEHNAFISLNRNYMYMCKDTSYLGSKLLQVTFSKRK